MFETIIGQHHIKQRLSILIEYSINGGQRLPDLFFAGPGGVGKSTIARLVAKELKWATDTNPAFVELNATSAKNMAELLSFLHDNQGIPVEFNVDSCEVYVPRCVIFIDEIHKVKEPLKTELLNATDEARQTTFKVFKDKILTAYFKDVTFIAATTDKNDLSDAFLSRFQTFELIPYSSNEIAQAVTNKTGWPIESALEIGKRAKTIMRTAMLDIVGISAFLSVKYLQPTANNLIRYYSELKRVDDIGLDDIDYKMLSILDESVKPLGLKAIATRMRKPEKEVESREGFLSSVGLIEKVASGRVISKLGLDRLNKVQLIHTLQ